MGSDIFTGTLDTLILRAVAGGDMHGYSIGKWIREQSDNVLAIEEGALYPALQRIQRKGLLSSRWGKTETGRKARIYSLTAAGRAQLTDEIARWKSHSDAVNAVLRTQ